MTGRPAVTPLILIPTRMSATRLPGKPLADIGGKPMVIRAWEQAVRSGLPVAVAAGDQEIVDVIEAAGGRAVLTDPALPSGSDRVLAALEALDPDGDYDSIINLQGDMPFADPGIATACAALLHGEPGCDIATLVAPEADVSDRSNVDVVKAVADSHPISAAQVALAWLLAQGDDIVPIPGCKRLSTLEDSMSAADVVLTPDDLTRLDAAAPVGGTAGLRYGNPAMMAMVRR